MLGKDSVGGLVLSQPAVSSGWHCSPISLFYGSVDSEAPRIVTWYSHTCAVYLESVLLACVPMLV